MALGTRGVAIGFAVEGPGIAGAAAEDRTGQLLPFEPNSVQRPEQLLPLHQLNPDAVRVLHECLAPPIPPTDFAWPDENLDALPGEFCQGRIEVIHLEPEVVEVLAVGIGRSKPTSLGIPVKFEELLPARAAQYDDLALRGRRPLAGLNDLHPQDLGVESEGFVHVLDPDARVLQAIEVHRGATGLSRDKTLDSRSANFSRTLSPRLRAAGR